MDPSGRKRSEFPDGEKKDCRFWEFVLYLAVVALLAVAIPVFAWVAKALAR